MTIVKIRQESNPLLQAYEEALARADANEPLRGPDEPGWESVLAAAAMGVVIAFALYGAWCVAMGRLA